MQPSQPSHPCMPIKGGVSSPPEPPPSMHPACTPSETELGGSLSSATGSLRRPLPASPGPPAKAEFIGERLRQRARELAAQLLTASDQEQPRQPAAGCSSGCSSNDVGQGLAGLAAPTATASCSPVHPALSHWGGGDRVQHSSMTASPPLGSAGVSTAAASALEGRQQSGSSSSTVRAAGDTSAGSEEGAVRGAGAAPPPVATDLGCSSSALHKVSRGAVAVLHYTR